MQLSGSINQSIDRAVEAAASRLFIAGATPDRFDWLSSRVLFKADDACHRGTSPRSALRGVSKSRTAAEGGSRLMRKMSQMFETAPALFAEAISQAG
jgi:hypothetical protein